MSKIKFLQVQSNRRSPKLTSNLIQKVYQITKLFPNQMTTMFLVFKRDVIIRDVAIAA
jgi:hypothetical protein